MVMLKSIDDKNNIIYGDLSLQKNLKLEFKGSNNIAFLIGSSINLTLFFMETTPCYFMEAGALLIIILKIVLTFKIMEYVI